jgi:hypothetical protein
MNPLDVWAISVVAGGAAGVLGGVAVNWLLDRDERGTSDPAGEPLGSALSARVDDVARDWAYQHGRLGAEQIAAGKLRLALKLQRRNRRVDLRARRRLRRW